LGIKKFYFNLLDFPPREKVPRTFRTFRQIVRLNLLVSKSLFKNFYLRAFLWSLFCLAFGLMSSLVNAELKKAVPFRDKEAAVLWAISDIRRSQSDYAAKHGGRYAQTFEELIKAEKFDPDFDRKYPVVFGYVFEMKVSEPADQAPAFFSIEAEPWIYGVSDSPHKRRFYSDSTLETIKVTEQNRPATAADPSI
jgi:hypothetical protein